MRSEHPVCHGSLMTTLTYGLSLACLAHFGPLVPAMNKGTSWAQSASVDTKAYCFHDYKL